MISPNVIHQQNLQYRGKKFLRIKLIFLNEQNSTKNYIHLKIYFLGFVLMSSGFLSLIFLVQLFISSAVSPFSD
jgi:hypothetical protein